MSCGKSNDEHIELLIYTVHMYYKYDALEQKLAIIIQCPQSNYWRSTRVSSFNLAQFFYFSMYLKSYIISSVQCYSVFINFLSKGQKNLYQHLIIYPTPIWQKDWSILHVHGQALLLSRNHKWFHKTFSSMTRLTFPYLVC